MWKVTVFALALQNLIGFLVIAPAWFPIPAYWPFEGPDDTLFTMVSMVIGTPLLIYCFWCAPVIGAMQLLRLAVRPDAKSFHFLVCVAGGAYAMLYGFYFGYLLKDAAIEGLTVRSKPLIHAIERYRIDTGALPKTLETLVPNHLAYIPSTGILSSPNYYYRMNEDDYELVLYSFGPRLFQIEKIFYWPSGDYPERIDGDWVRLMGSWAMIPD